MEAPSGMSLTASSMLARTLSILSPYSTFRVVVSVRLSEAAETVGGTTHFSFVLCGEFGWVHPLTKERIRHERSICQFWRRRSAARAHRQSRFGEECW